MTTTTTTTRTTRPLVVAVSRHSRPLEGELLSTSCATIMRAVIPTRRQTTTTTPWTTTAVEVVRRADDLRVRLLLLLLLRLTEMDTRHDPCPLSSLFHLTPIATMLCRCQTSTRHSPMSGNLLGQTPGRCGNSASKLHCPPYWTSTRCAVASPFHRRSLGPSLMS